VHVRRLFGTTGYCSACSKLIPAFEMIMKAKNNVYHLECFACQRCSQRSAVHHSFMNFRKIGTNACFFLFILIFVAVDCQKSLLLNSSKRLQQGCPGDLSYNCIWGILKGIPFPSIERLVLHLEPIMMLMLTQNRNFDCKYWFYNCTNASWTAHFVYRTAHWKALASFHGTVYTDW